MSNIPEDQDDGSSIRFSRSGVTPVGKCTATLKTHIPEEIDKEFRYLATMQGCTPSELLRDMVCLVTRQKTYGELAAEDRRSLAETSGPGKGFFEGLFRPSKKSE